LDAFFVGMLYVIPHLSGLFSTLCVVIDLDQYNYIYICIVKNRNKTIPSFYDKNINSENG